MYAKWIHPRKIVIHEGHILRHNGRIVINPKERDYLLAEYFPVKIKAGQDISAPDNIYVVREKSIIILDKEDV